MNDPLSEILLSRKVIRRRVAELGALIASELQGLSLCIMPVLDGGMIFAADLVREIPLPLTMLSIKASSYGDGMESSGTVTFPAGIPGGIQDKDLLLVDDILDTGKTLEALCRELLAGGARSVRTCVLLRKKSSGHLSPDYVGFEIPNVFVVGYGLDLAGKHRNHPCIGIPAR